VVSDTVARDYYEVPGSNVRWIVTYTLSGDDVGDFKFVWEGRNDYRIATTAVPDFERPQDDDQDNVYVFNLRISAPNHPSSLVSQITDDFDYTLTIANDSSDAQTPTGLYLDLNPADTQGRVFTNYKHLNEDGILPENHVGNVTTPTNTRFDLGALGHSGEAGTVTFTLATTGNTMDNSDFRIIAGRLYYIGDGTDINFEAGDFKTIVVNYSGAATPETFRINLSDVSAADGDSEVVTASVALNVPPFGTAAYTLSTPETWDSIRIMSSNGVLPHTPGTVTVYGENDAQFDNATHRLIGPDAEHFMFVEVASGELWIVSKRGFDFERPVDSSQARDGVAADTARNTYVFREEITVSGAPPTQNDFVITITDISGPNDPDII
jgi:hypothetical protein